MINLVFYYSSRDEVCLEKQNSVHGHWQDAELAVTKQERTGGCRKTLAEKRSVQKEKRSEQITAAVWPVYW